MEGAFARAKVKIPLNTVNTMSMQTFLQILKGAPMVGMLPEAMVIDQVKEGQLQILETDLVLDAQDYGILTRKGEPVSVIASVFINILLKNAKRK
ncbi:hypothetical protein D9M73_234010 [compost metagenome]